MLSDPPRNMLAQSQSGTGKTAAFVTAILSRVDFSQPEQPQALVLAPSRELARQIEGVVTAIGRFVENLKIAPAIPGALPRGEPVRASVVIGTPGTVMDIVRRRQLDVSKLRVLVLDEADNMLDQQGLGDQCMRVKGLVKLASPYAHRTLTQGLQHASKGYPDPVVFSYVPRQSQQLRVQVCAERAYPEAAEKRAYGQGHLSDVHRLP